ncbi:MAG: hypothetical protein ACHQUB_03685 [Candidatus Saccharimonadia bacterium]
MPSNAVMTERAAAALRRVHGADVVITPTSLWIYKILTQQGRLTEPDTYDIGRDLFYSNPPIRGRVDRCKVLICSTSAQSEVAMQNAPKQAAVHNISRPNLVFCRCLDTFWANFFSCEDYIGDNQRRRPALIVSTGSLRNYSQLGGETVTVSDRLKEIASRWSVPLELI